jgi:glycosyltransferase involved in cell wall biosynthesis
MSVGDDGAVDVVIPVRNGARFLESCLDSVMAQTGAPPAVIVVDDGSTDGTAAIVQSHKGRWPALRLVRTDRRGLPHARNTGIEAFLLQALPIVDRWYKTPKFSPQLRAQYRRTVAYLPILRAKRQPAQQLRRQLELFREIKRGTGRLGHDLFSGPVDFLGAIYGTRLNSLWHRFRRLQAEHAKLGLAPYQASTDRLCSIFRIKGR